MGKAVNKPKQATPATASAKAPPPVAPPVRVPPLFRAIDWLTLAITVAVVWTTYFVMLATELTLEDSGELVTGSFYAGIPHPPGYPVWTMYSWLWTTLLKVGSIEWRVAVGQATSGALACGLIALMVSRGSSMLMEGIEELKNMTGRWENAICIVSGCVAGLLVGYDGFMWGESVVVNRIAVFSVPWFMMVLLCLLRWIYAPHQTRYIYWALFLYGICITTHQSLLVASIGIEVTLAAGNPRLGRDVFLGNFVIYMIYNLVLLATGQQIFQNIAAKPGLLILFHAVGLGSLIVSGWLAVWTKTKGIEIGRNLALLAAVGSFVLMFLYSGKDSGLFVAFGVAGVAAVGLFIYLAWKTWHLGREWLVVTIMGLLWILGVSFYFYMPVSGMTNPPMQWGYPRTVEGFFHALTRGQYEQPSPTNVFADPGRFIGQLGMLIGGTADEYTWVFILIALVPFLFFFKLQKRERVWLICLTAIYLCVGVLLLILLNPSPDLASSDLIKVFLISSHTIVAILIGYGLALIAAYMATHYQRFRRWGLLGGGVATLLALYSLMNTTAKHYFGSSGQIRLSWLPEWVGQTFTFGPKGQVSFSELPHWIAQAFAKDQYGLPIFAGLILVGLAFVFTLALLAYRSRAPLLIALALFTAMPLCSALSHWFSSEQRDHWFGYWFGHDMFTPPFKGADGKPLYPEMTKDAILFGGTDPGRFCPTYIIFVESFTPHDCQPVQDQKFDRRDVYIITQNALADGTYLCYLRAQYNRSKQIDPPFFQELLRSAKEKELNYKTNLLARLVSPLDRVFMDLGARVEKRRRTFTSWFTDKDFTDLPAFAAKLRPAANQDPLSKWLYENFSKETQDLVAGSQSDPARLRKALEKDLNWLLDRDLQIKKSLKAKQQEKDAVDEEIADDSNSERLRQKQEQLAKEIADLSKAEPLFTASHFQKVKLSDYILRFVAQDPQSDTRIRLNRLLLEEAYPKEIARSLGGVYPDREIYIPSPDDSQHCFNDYLEDARRRMQLNQLRPGEDVHVADNRVQVGGQVAVMSINGLLCKVIFDNNPENEFFIEESFPLDWMYPYLTPYGVIMKINRQPLTELSEDVFKRDHEFWKQFSTRLIGDIIDYDTPIKQVVEWIEKTYLRHDFTGFKGDRKFIRDKDAQKSFSKLRSSIGGIYAWRIGAGQSACPAEYRPKTNEEFQRMLKEADFSFLQSFAFCPYSPEAVFRYIHLLTQFNRVDDALLIAETCLKLDPYNGQVSDLVDRLREAKKQEHQVDQFRSNLQRLEDEVQKNPANSRAALSLAAAYLQAQQTNRAMDMLDRVVKQTNVEATVLVAAAQTYLQMRQTNHATEIFDRVVKQTNPDVTAVAVVAQTYAQLDNLPKLEVTLEKLVALAPDQPETWYDLAALKGVMGNSGDALQALRHAVELSNERLKHDPKARNLIEEARKDQRFDVIRLLPEFQQLIPTK